MMIGDRKQWQQAEWWRKRKRGKVFDLRRSCGRFIFVRRPLRVC